MQCTHLCARIATTLQNAAPPRCFTATRNRRHQTAAPSSRNDDAASALPWSLTFDLRERETLWTDENKVRLLKIVSSQHMGISQEELESRLQSLLYIVPDLASAVATMKVSLLTQLLQDVGVLPGRLIALKEALPTANVSALVARQPVLLLSESEAVEKSVGQLRQVLQVADVDRMVEQNPAFLDVEHVQEVLEEMQRLMGQAADVRHMLLRDPSWLLRVERGEKRLGQHPDSDWNMGY